MSLTKRSYSKKSDWEDSPEFSIKSYYIHYTWEPIFQLLFDETDRTERIEKDINEEIKKSGNKIYPKPEYVFRAFQITSFRKTRVVFIGQDPYFNSEEYKDVFVPQAYGLSFSVPYDFKIPSSLDNIYKNLIKFGHMKKKPDHGCLDFWAQQGCLMLNTSLTVVDGKKNCHSNTWRSFTDDIIRFINRHSKYVVFVLWGAEAFKKVNMIDLDVHDVIVSSHPSGLSCEKKMGSHEAFSNVDHFGKINKCLRSRNYIPIQWDLN